MQITAKQSSTMFSKVPKNNANILLLPGPCQYKYQCHYHKTTLRSFERNFNLDIGKQKITFQEPSASINPNRPQKRPHPIQCQPTALNAAHSKIIRAAPTIASIGQVSKGTQQSVLHSAPKEKKKKTSQYSRNSTEAGAAAGASDLQGAKAGAQKWLPTGEQGGPTWGNKSRAGPK